MCGAELYLSTVMVTSEWPNLLSSNGLWVGLHDEEWGEPNVQQRAQSLSRSPVRMYHMIVVEARKRLAN